MPTTHCGTGSPLVHHIPPSVSQYRAETLQQEMSLLEEGAAAVAPAHPLPTITTAPGGIATAVKASPSIVPVGGIVGTYPGASSTALLPQAASASVLSMAGTPGDGDAAGSPAPAGADFTIGPAEGSPAKVGGSGGGRAGGGGGGFHPTVGALATVGGQLVPSPVSGSSALPVGGGDVAAEASAALGGDGGGVGGDSDAAAEAEAAAEVLSRQRKAHLIAAQLAAAQLGAAATDSFATAE